MEGRQPLHLEDLRGELPGATRAIGATCYEATLICMEACGHQKGVGLDVVDFEARIAAFDLLWNDQVLGEMKRAWGEARNAVEDAATGIAFLILPECSGYTMIERSNIGSGVDYWLGDTSDVMEYKIQRTARLEISGIVNARSLGQIRQRVRDKLSQTRRSEESGLPAYVIVVAMSEPIVYLVRK